jgi:hypothetical protein
MSRAHGDGGAIILLAPAMFHRVSKCLQISPNFVSTQQRICSDA